MIHLLLGDNTAPGMDSLRLELPQGIGAVWEGCMEEGAFES